MIAGFSGLQLLVERRQVYARVRVTRAEIEAAMWRRSITMEEILGGDIGGGEPTAPGAADYGQGAHNMLKTIGEPPTIKQRLEHEIAVTEKRLYAMKAGLEVIQNAPALEVLQRALAAVNRHNY